MLIDNDMYEVAGQKVAAFFYSSHKFSSVIVSLCRWGNIDEFDPSFRSCRKYDYFTQFYQ